MNKHQKGLAPIIIALIVLVLAGIGGTGYYLINKNNLKEVNQNQQLSTIPSITIISPKQGESLETGKTYDIAWSSQNVEKISFYLQKQGETDVALIMGNNTQASLRKYYWTIPTDNNDINLGGQFRIGIFADENNSPIAYSDWFGIISSTTSVVTNEIGINFCKDKGGFVDYSAILNFDSDLEKELLVICGDIDMDRSVDVDFNEGRKLYILDKQNEEYKLIWEKDMSKYDGVRESRSMKKPEIIDVDKDGIDEIFFTIADWGGACSWNYGGYFLYSPKYNEMFDVGILTDVVNMDCNNTKIVKISPSDNLSTEKYKVFKNFLKEKTGILTDDDLFQD